jgi:uncharacterized protein YbcI
MENPSHCEEQKKTIAHFTGIFLKENFDTPSQAIRVLMDHHMVVIAVEDFLSPAEIEIGTEERNTELVQEMYSRLFQKVKSPLVDQLIEITSKRVISSQISINLEKRLFMITFFLDTKSISEGNHSLV